MSFFKRALLNIKRNLGKSLTLLVLVFVLATIISGAISIQQAVVRTEENLQLSLPAIATILFDRRGFELASENEGVGQEGGSMTVIVGPDEFVTIDDIQRIGDLEHVAHYSYSLRYGELFSSDLVRAWGPPIPEGIDLDSDEFLGMDIETDMDSIRNRGMDFEVFLNNRGVSSPLPLEFLAGAMELLDGDGFTQEQLDQGAQVVMVSAEFAAANDLQIGSIMELEQNLFDLRGAAGNHAGSRWSPAAAFHEDYRTYQRIYPLEVVGIFELTRHFDWEHDFLQAVFDWGDAVNTFFMPNALIDQMQQAQRHHWLVTENYFLLDMPVQFDTTFLLHDSRQMPAFMEAAHEILPDFWIIGDLSNHFSGINASMDMMLWIADLILVASVASTLVILSLLIVLFLKDRKQEIGILMALGEKKSKILLQLLSETFSISIVAMTAAVFAGSLISSGMSRQLLKTHLIQYQEESMAQGWDPNSSIPWQLEAFNPGEPTVEEMMAAFDTSLNNETILLFYGIGLSSILLSASAPLTYIVRFNPKKILL